MTTKQCTRCAATFPLDDFYRNRNSTDGHQHYCKTCLKAQIAAGTKSGPIDIFDLTPKVIFRFAARLSSTKSGCVKWSGACGERGHGMIRIRGKVVGAHRVSWMIANGDIPDGLFVLHRCDNPPCVKPSHLFLGTQADNMEDMRAKGRDRTGAAQKAKTHCPAGHPYDELNTYHYRNRRICRQCSYLRTKARQANGARSRSIDLAVLAVC